MIGRCFKNIDDQYHYMVVGKKIHKGITLYVLRFGYNDSEIIFENDSFPSNSVPSEMEEEMSRVEWYRKKFQGI